MRGTCFFSSSLRRVKALWGTEESVGERIRFSQVRRLAEKVKTQLLSSYYEKSRWRRSTFLGSKSVAGSA